MVDASTHEVDQLIAELKNADSITHVTTDQIMQFLHNNISHSDLEGCERTPRRSRQQHSHGAVLAPLLGSAGAVSSKGSAVCPTGLKKANCQLTT